MKNTTIDCVLSEAYKAEIESATRLAQETPVGKLELALSEQQEGIEAMLQEPEFTPDYKFDITPYNHGSDESYEDYVIESEEPEIDMSGKSAQYAFIAEQAEVQKEIINDHRNARLKNETGIGLANHDDAIAPEFCEKEAKKNLFKEFNPQISFMLYELADVLIC